MADAPDLIYQSIDPNIVKANAAFIVKACNSHDDLVKALEAMTDRWEPDCIGTDRIMWENALAALALAKGEA